MKSPNKVTIALLAIGTIAVVWPGSAFAQPQAALEIALSHLNANAVALGLTAEDLADKAVTDQYRSEHNGVTHIHFGQRLQGIEVANGTINVNVTADGRVLNVGNRFVGSLSGKVNSRRPALIAESAIRSAAEQLGLEIPNSLFETGATGGPAQRTTFNGAGLSLDEIPVKLAFYATDSGEVRLTWEMNIRETGQMHWWNLWVDAETGEILAKVDWIAKDTYQVYALPKESPTDGPRTIEVNPANATGSPFGWHDTNGVAGADFTDTRGNNVSAQEDRDANNIGGFRPDGGAGLDFQFPIDLATQSPVDYQAAAVANLFYWNNIMHDLLFQYGFDEASGNFQENNYSGAPGGSDSVNADAQDGSSTNNATFGTPADGQNPRMSMFEWTPPNDAIVTVNSPGSIAGDYTAAAAGFGAALTLGGITGDFELVDDGTALGSEGCGSLVGFTSGRIAMIDRGTCEFGLKVLNAENAGASAAIVVNNQGDGVIAMGPGTNGGSVTIAAAMIGQSDGGTIKAELGGGVNGTVKDAGNAIPNRDSDLDAGVIAHEYCHGLSNRLTGGRTNVNCLSGNQQAGEGWSDLCTLFFTADAADTGTTARGVGTYLTFEPANGAGIRDFPYSTDMVTNPQTYGDLLVAGQAGGPSIPHGVGTVWATAVWEVYWNLVNDQGFDADLYNGTGGNNTAIQLVVDGLKLQGCNPTFLDGRDGILAADQANNGGANECLIWSGFAKRGMGFSAQDGGGSSSLNVTQAFDLPPQCIVGCGNGICELGESCDGATPGTVACPSDCVSGTSSGAVCGNGICEAGDGEDCVSCAADCNGKQNGKPSNRFCCGDGGGQNPIVCDGNTAVCNQGGFSCTDVPVSGGSFCCGDTSCDAGEDSLNCELDCGPAGFCGDNMIDPGETCDGADLGGQDCISQGCTGGTLACSGDCSDFDTSGCTGCSTCVPTHSKEKGPRCSDGLDNDCDGMIDGADPDC